MVSNLSRIFSDSSSGFREKVIGLYTLLIGANIFAWVLAILVFHRYPLLLGTGLIAYTFGLRHAVDADHISAIDNVTRKLMSEKKKPVGVGFFFSLGHSTIVVALTIIIAVTATTVQKNFPGLQNIGGLIGTSVSALFLFIIATINMLVLWEIFHAFRKVKNGGEYNEQTLDEFLNQRGLMGRFFRPMLKMISKSWHMYPLGFLFGLGFDTATEIGILGISASSATKGLPIWTILIFPALFLVGMCLVDSTDSILMLGAYGWAFVKPVRKLYYNMNITLVSVLIALIVGGIEALSVISDQLHLGGSFWHFVGNLSNNFGLIGYAIIGIFILSWLCSTLIYKIKKYDDIEVVPSNSARVSVESEMIAHR
jgi:high-affinity nickel-transport protein